MIEHYTFGTFIIDGKRYESNVKLIGDKASAARYLEGHILRKDDFDELIGAKPDYIVIGTGANGVVNVTSEIEEYIESNGIKLIVEKTGQACDLYNEMLKKGEKVACFLHNTC